MERIVVGFDGSRRSQDALYLGALLAAPTAATVVAGRVLPLGAEAGARGPAGLDELALAGIRIAARTVTASSPARGLHELAAAEQADVLVIGSSGRGTGGRLMLGPVGERLLEGAPLPVVVSPAGFRDRDRLADLHVVGAGFDGSAESVAALRFAADIARERAAILRVIAAAPPSGGWTRLTEAVQQAVEDLPRDVRTELCVRRGDPAAVIAQAAEDGVDLLVAGSRSYAPSGSVHLGAVTRHLAFMAVSPLMVVPRPVGRVAALPQPRVHALA